MVEGVDYAFSNPSPAGLAVAGKRFAMRYVGPGTSPKHLTVAEANALKAAGLSIVLLVEGAADSAAGGRSVGRQHAQLAVQMCKERGFPTSRPMYFAVDYDINTGSWAGPREYLRGAGEIIGPNLVGVYGEYDAMVWAKRDGVAAWFFQTYAWSAGRWFAGNHVEQYRNGVSLAGGTVDLCRAKMADFGQWPISSTISGVETDMFMAQITGNPAVWISNGVKYRGVPDGATFYRLRDQVGVKLIVVANAVELANLCGEVEVPGPDPVTLTAEQMAAIAAAAKAGAAEGAGGLSYEETVKAAQAGAELAEDN